MIIYLIYRQVHKEQWKIITHFKNTIKKLTIQLLFIVQSAYFLHHFQILPIEPLASLSPHSQINNNHKQKFVNYKASYSDFFANIFQIVYTILHYNNQMKRQALLLLLLVLALSDTCGGNCPAGDCTACFCGAQKNMVDIDTWCGKFTWNKTCCKCIVSHQSGGNAHTTTHNDNGSTDVGLWQINTINWNSCSGGSAPCDPNTNLNCATTLYKASGNNWTAWKSHKTCGC